MVAALIVRKPNNSILYDTSKAAYGLIKAGPVVAAGQWNRLDPNKGNKPSYFADDIYKFEVENAVSPIVFVYGKSGKPFQSMEGNKQVFYFAGPVSGIQVYCFDLMRPIFTGPALKTRGEDGGLTFNSLQFPLNVKGTSTPPPVKYFDNGTLWPFTGGTNPPDWPMLPAGGNGSRAGIFSTRIRVPLDASKKYAAHIPWNRGVEWVGYLSGVGTDRWRGGGEEGCYGEDGAVAHIIWASPETSFASVHTTTRFGWFNMQNDLRPACSYIELSEYPYPFNT
ncbi:hypothetical protein [Pseudomonas sessilinigenes]|uniref:Uncharacterized protein n=1 Tax=Pseudomonas sessilinigenes TaxID=658629 RepID=A0ABX8MXE0_9PSED|nr:hypothetical protein [Pseudomonas sessilinigenes]AZC22940.1 hypothetical protein C4K39_1245 [Pseudomonas sessilinigenes]QXH41971.1 hypothetical protein KSS89_07040 [Pseudomonas sessilinigenes]